MTRWGPAIAADPQPFLDISLKLSFSSVKKQKCLDSPDEKMLVLYPPFHYNKLRSVKMASRCVKIPLRNCVQQGAAVPLMP